MSLVDLRHIPLPAPPIAQAPADEPLTDAERAEVRAILELVAAKLVARGETSDSLRRCLGAIVGSLIDVTDALDGDADAEPLTATETCGRGFTGTPTIGTDDDEDGHDREHELTDDSGIADDDGRAEQLGLRDNYGAWVPA